jgi:hypothetical protein
MSVALTLKERFERALGSFQSYWSRPKNYLARIEYWIYLPGAELPSQEAIMRRMTAENPYVFQGGSPITPAEGILFSDVRTHIALVLKKKNPRIFRTDVFPDFTQVSAEAVTLIESAESMVKVRYVSEEKLKDKRHISFSAHAADAIAELGEGSLIYDNVAEKLWTREEFSEELRRHPKGDSSELHVRAVWRQVEASERMETRGLQKLGLKDLKTAEMSSDEKSLVRSLIELGTDQIWQNATIPESLSVNLFDAQFRLLCTSDRDEFTHVRVMRLDPE